MLAGLFLEENEEDFTAGACGFPPPENEVSSFFSSSSFFPLSQGTGTLRETLAGFFVVAASEAGDPSSRLVCLGNAPDDEVLS